MTKSHMRIIIWTLPVFSFLLLSPPLHAQQFSVHDLGLLGGPSAGAFSVSANRLVVGYSALANADFHGFLWDGALHDLLPLAGDTQSHAFSINGSGQVVGVSYVMGGLVQHAILWEGNSMVGLGDFTPQGITEGGTIAGCTSMAINGKGWVDRACVYSHGALVTLATLGGSFSYAHDANETDQVVGMSYTSGENARRACLWQNGQVIDLGTLGGNNSQAYAINDMQHVVGVSDTGAGKMHAFRYTLSGGAVAGRTDLGELAGGYSYAYDINNHGEVVGTSDSRAVYWSGGAPVDLNRRIPQMSAWTLSSARQISAEGLVVGTGYLLGIPHAFVLEPAAPDYDLDLDVDQEDFAHFQRCYTGTDVPQDDPACWNALLDGDSDVDRDDFLVFQACRSGPGLPATDDCWR